MRKLAHYCSTQTRSAERVLCVGHVYYALKNMQKNHGKNDEKMIYPPPSQRNKQLEDLQSRENDAIRYTSTTFPHGQVHSGGQYVSPQFRPNDWQNSLVPAVDKYQHVPAFVETSHKPVPERLPFIVSEIAADSVGKYQGKISPFRHCSGAPKSMVDSFFTFGQSTGTGVPGRLGAKNRYRIYHHTNCPISSHLIG